MISGNDDCRGSELMQKRIGREMTRTLKCGFPSRVVLMLSHSTSKILYCFVLACTGMHKYTCGIVEDQTMIDCAIFSCLKKDSVCSCKVNCFAQLGNILCTENAKDQLAIVNLSLKMTFYLHF